MLRPVLLAAVLLTACNQTTPTSTTTTRPTPTTTTTTTRPTTTTTVPGTDWHAVVDGVLERYGRALTDLAVDPTARGSAGTPFRAAWDAVVLPGSWLSQDMSAQLLRRQHVERVVVVPGADGVSYRHRPVLVEPPLDGTVSFTWCGWSPGLGVDVDTGEVVDDRVAHARGTGQLRWSGDAWWLETLDELDLEILSPGSPDPCTP